MNKLKKQEGKIIRTEKRQRGREECENENITLFLKIEPIFAHHIDHNISFTVKIYRRSTLLGKTT